MSYDDQYDAPLSGVERVRVTALRLTEHPHSATGAEAWVEAARPLERYIIGDRATRVMEQIDAAYTLADKLLRDLGGDPWAEPNNPTAPLAELRELVKILSGLADGPPF